MINTEQRNIKGVRVFSVIHGFSFIMPKEFSWRKLLNVYMLETLRFSPSLSLSLTVCFGWKLTFDRWFCILLLPCWIYSLLFSEDSGCEPQNHSWYWRGIRPSAIAPLHRSKLTVEFHWVSTWSPVETEWTCSCILCFIYTYPVAHYVPHPVVRSHFYRVHCCQADSTL